jgi:hypothetical protein
MRNPTRPTANLAREQQRDRARRLGMSGSCNAKQSQEGDHAGAVVEQALAGDLRLERPRHAEFAQNGNYRDRVGRRDERAEQQAVDEFQP